MPAIVLVGAQWGDEGKGKATDQLGATLDYCVRYQGGNNAGHTIVIDGHDFAQIDSAILSAKAQDKPTMIIAKTIKGKGVSFVESKGAGNHNMPFSMEDAARAIAEIRGEA